MLEIAGQYLLLPSCYMYHCITITCLSKHYQYLGKKLLLETSYLRPKLSYCTLYKKKRLNLKVEAVKVKKCLMYFWTNIYLWVFCDFVPKYIYISENFRFFLRLFSLMHYFVRHWVTLHWSFTFIFFLFIQESSFPTKIFSDPLLNFLNYNFVLLFWSFSMLNIYCCFISF